MGSRNVAMWGAAAGMLPFGTRASHNSLNGGGGVPSTANTRSAESMTLMDLEKPFRFQLHVGYKVGGFQ